MFLIKIFRKIFKYFIYKPLLFIIFEFTYRQNDFVYVIFFKIYSILIRGDVNISSIQKKFYIKGYNWCFSEKKLGLYAYSKGIKKRINELKEVYLLSKINFKDNDVIVDCGANNGDLSLCFDKKVKYVGIEPSPEIFKNLKHNVKKQTLINAALWKTSKKKIQFYLSDDFGDSSIIPIKNWKKIINIKTIRLDEILSNYKKVKLVKIEAEGAEPEILLGGIKSLKKVEFISIDVGFERGLDQSSTLVECTNFMLRNNFSLIDFRWDRLVLLFKNKN